MKRILVMMLVVAMLALGAVAFAATSSVQQSGNCVYGSTTSTGAAINVALGFYPSSVLVSRVSTTAANNFQMYYTASMTDASGVLHTAGALTWVTTAGISKYTSTTYGKGFTLGTNSSINPSSPADTLYYEACR